MLNIDFVEQCDPYYLKKKVRFFNLSHICLRFAKFSWHLDNPLNLKEESIFSFDIESCQEIKTHNLLYHIHHLYHEKHFLYWMKDEKNILESEKFEMFLRAIVIVSSIFFIFNKKLMINDN